MKKVVVDFESYYDKEISVTTLGLRNYVKATDAYIVSVVTDDIEFCGTIADLPKQFGDAWIQDPSLQFCAANSNFDQAWWEKYYPAPVHPWKCVLDQAAFHQFPRDLAGVCKVALHETIDKALRDEMKGKHFEELPEAKQQEVIEYCLNDSIKEKLAMETMKPMSPMEERLAAHTRLLNRRGVHLNLEKLERDCQHLSMVLHTATHALPWVEEGAKPLSYQAFASWCRVQEIEPPASLDKRDAVCNEWMLQNPDQACMLQNMRTVRGANAKLEKLKLMVASADDSGVMPLDLLYCAARHTRRWSAKTINVQNLDAKRVFEDEMRDLPYFQENPEEKPGIFMREYLIPPPGKKFGIIDYSQIEPRCLNWIVGNEELLTAIRLGYGIYEAHAKATMGWKGDPGTLKKNPELYKYAKERVLSLGYGMGADKFQATIKLKLGLDISTVEAKKQVDNFRQTNRKIVGQWRKLDSLIKQAAMAKDDHTLSLQMPTGDTLTHFNVRAKLSGGFESWTIKGDRSMMSHQPRLWGGTLTENITQRMARDVLAEALLRLEDNGIPVVFHAHDEIITLLDASSAEQDFAEAKRIMAVPPDWCPDLPLGVDGAVCDTYTKLQ